MSLPPKGAPLPDSVQSALHAISRDLRNVPRDCIVDRAELFHWLRRQANRVDGVRDMKLIAAPKPPLPRPQTLRENAEAAFSGPVHQISRPTRRTIMSRKGRRVLVETRQLEMSL